MRHEVSDVLQKLIREKEQKEHVPGRPESVRHNLTSLGVPLIEQEHGDFLIDLTDVRVFAGLSTFVHLLINDIIYECRTEIADVMVQRKVDGLLTPELADIGLDWVVVYARSEVANRLPSYQEIFIRNMHLAFGAVQTAQWGGLLFPGFFNMTENNKDHTSPALLFPFYLLAGENEPGYFFLLEYAQADRFLRITIEDAATSRLQLKHISHRVVDNLDQQSYLRDIKRVAEQIYQGILRECQNYRAEYREILERQPELFGHLGKGGLTDLTTILFRWPTDDEQRMLLEQRNQYTSNESFLMLNKALLLLEDPDVLRVLARGCLVEMVAGSYRIFFDVSRRGTCLNISFNERRELLTLDHYLDQMPLLREASRAGEGSFQNVRLFLIHHFTAEVLALIKAFQKSGCMSIKTFFVKYEGIIPDEYLETLLSLPEDTFRFYGLQKIKSSQSIKGNYMLSRQYSTTVGLDRLDQILEKGQFDFLESMRIAAGYLFFQEAVECRKEGKMLLLVEDGGYLAPLINRFCLENASLREVLSYFRVVDSVDPDEAHIIAPEEMEMHLSEWLAEVFVGSVEHTKNGYDYNNEVMQGFGRLQFPACSIAISDVKRGPEAKECSNSIINAIENILHRMGLMLSQRRVLILGSSGAIGSKMITDLAHRIGPENVCGVDIDFSGENKKGYMEVQTPEELGEEILFNTDLVIGVVGKSIIKEALLRKLILEGKPKSLFFASGSTKTVEFKDLENWLHELSMQDHPQISGKAVQIMTNPIRDLQTNMLQGHRVSITFDDQSALSKNIYLLGGLTPINFLYYGIPREIIDEVMSQLLKVSNGLIRHYKGGSRLPSRLLAVDHEIDTDANLTSVNPDRYL